MDKKVLVEPIGADRQVLAQGNYVYAATSHGVAVKPPVLAYNILKPPTPVTRSNVIMRPKSSDISNTVVVRDNSTLNPSGPSRSNLQVTMTMGSEKIHFTSNTAVKQGTNIYQKPGTLNKIYMKRPINNVYYPVPQQIALPPLNITKTPKGVTTNRSTLTKKTYKRSSTSKNQPARDMSNPRDYRSSSTNQVSVTNSVAVQLVKNPASALPFKSKSIKILKKNLMTLDEDTKAKMSSMSSVQKFLEKDTLEKGLEVLDHLDNSALAVLVSNVMDVTNKMYGDYLAEELSKHLGTEKYNQIADGGLTTFSEFLAQRHSMGFRNCTPVKMEDQTEILAEATRSASARTNPHFSKGQGFIKLDPDLLSKSKGISTVNQQESLKSTNSSNSIVIISDHTNDTSDGSVKETCYEEADKSISAKISSFRRRDISEDSFSFNRTGSYSGVPERIFESTEAASSPKDLAINTSYMCKKAKETRDITSESSKEVSNKGRKSPDKKDFAYDVDPLLCRPSQSVRDNKSVVLSSPEMLNASKESRSSSGSIKKFDGFLSPMLKSPEPIGFFNPPLFKTPERSGDFLSPSKDGYPGFSPTISRYPNQQKIESLVTRIKDEEDSSVNNLETFADKVEEKTVENVSESAEDPNQQKIESLVARIRDEEDSSVNNLEVEEKTFENDKKVPGCEKVGEITFIATSVTKIEENDLNSIFKVEKEENFRELEDNSTTAEKVAVKENISEVVVGSEKNIDSKEEFARAIVNAEDKQDTISRTGCKKMDINNKIETIKKENFGSSTNLEDKLINTCEVKNLATDIEAEMLTHLTKADRMNEENAASIKTTNAVMETEILDRMEVDVGESKKTKEEPATKLYKRMEVDDNESGDKKEETTKIDERMEVDVNEFNEKEGMITKPNGQKDDEFNKKKEVPIKRLDNEKENETAIEIKINPEKGNIKVADKHHKQTLLPPEEKPFWRNDADMKQIRDTDEDIKTVHEEPLQTKSKELSVEIEKSEKVVKTNSTRSDTYDWFFSEVDQKTKTVSYSRDSPDLEQSMRDLAELLISFQQSEPPKKVPPSKSGISNDSFESFAQKNTVTIEDDEDCVIVETSPNLEESEKDLAVLLKEFQDSSKEKLGEACNLKAAVQDEDDCVLVEIESEAFGTPKEKADSPNGNFTKIIVPRVKSKNSDASDCPMNTKRSPAKQGAKKIGDESLDNMTDITSEILNEEAKAVIMDATSNSKAEKTAKRVTEAYREEPSKMSCEVLDRITKSEDSNKGENNTATKNAVEEALELSDKRLMKLVKIPSSEAERVQAKFMREISPKNKKIGFDKATFKVTDEECLKRATRKSHSSMSSAAQDAKPEVLQEPATTNTRRSKSDVTNCGDAVNRLSKTASSEDDDSVFVSEFVMEVAKTPLSRIILKTNSKQNFRRSESVQAQNQRHMLRKRVSFLSTVIRNRIRRVTKTCRHFITLVNHINLDLKDAGIDNRILKQNVKNLETISGQVYKNFMFKRMNFSKLKPALRKSCVAHGGKGGVSARILRRSKRNDKNHDCMISKTNENKEVVISEKVENERVVSSNKIEGTKAVVPKEVNSEAVVSKRVEKNGVATKKVKKTETVVSNEVKKGQKKIKSEKVAAKEINKSEAVIPKEIKKNGKNIGVTSKKAKMNSALPSKEVETDEITVSRKVGKSDAVVPKDVKKNEVMISKNVEKNEAIVPKDVFADKELKESEFDVKHEERVTMKPMKTYSRVTGNILKTKSDSDITIGNKLLKSSLFPNKSEYWDEITEDMIFKIEPSEDYILPSPGKRIVECFIYKRDSNKKQDGKEFKAIDMSTKIHSETKKPDLAVFIGTSPSNPEVVVSKENPDPVHERNQGNKRGSIVRRNRTNPSISEMIVVKKELPDPEDEKKQNEDPPQRKKRESNSTNRPTAKTVVLKEELSDPVDASGDPPQRGEKRKRNVSRSPKKKSATPLMEKTYNLRSRNTSITESVLTLDENKQTDVERSYTLRRRRSGNSPYFATI